MPSVQTYQPDPQFHPPPVRHRRTQSLPPPSSAPRRFKGYNPASTRADYHLTRVLHKSHRHAYFSVGDYFRDTDPDFYHIKRFVIAIDATHPARYRYAYKRLYNQRVMHGKITRRLLRMNKHFYMELEKMDMLDSVARWFKDLKLIVAAVFVSVVMMRYGYDIECLQGGWFCWVVLGCFVAMKGEVIGERAVRGWYWWRTRELFGARQ